MGEEWHGSWISVIASTLQEWVVSYQKTWMFHIHEGMCGSWWIGQRWCRVHRLAVAEFSLSSWNPQMGRVGSPWRIPTPRTHGMHSSSYSTPSGQQLVLHLGMAPSVVGAEGRQDLRKCNIPHLLQSKAFAFRGRPAVDFPSAFKWPFL